MRASSCRWLAVMAAIIPADVALAPPPQSSPANAAAEEGGGVTSARLPFTLNGTVRSFDFEEAADLGDALPPEFYRAIAPADGFPPFGGMRLARDADGAGRLLFELDGGSMSARINDGVAPVLPLADYIVTCRVRTEALTHARARLVAWLIDASGRAIPASRSVSAAINTHGAWETLSVEVRGAFRDATDLIFDLQLVQPAHLRSERAAASPLDRTAESAIREQTATPRPVLQDTAGQAWFDDVVIAHLPHVRLSMTGGSHIIRAPEVPEFTVDMSERSGAPQQARLRVYDLDGRIIFDGSFPAPRGRALGALCAPAPGCGWYRAVLDLTGGAGLPRQRSIDFVVLPAREARAVAARGIFGIALNHAQQAAGGALEMIRALAPHAVMLSIWGDAGAHATNKNGGHGLSEAARTLIDALLRDDVEIIFALQRVPDELARQLAIDAGRVLSVFAGDGSLWRPYLDEVLLNFGLQAPRWQIGAIDADASGPDSENLAERVAAAEAAFSAFVPQPLLFTPWPVESEAPVEATSSPTPPARTISIPSAVQPDAIIEYLQPWIDRGGEQIVWLDLLPEDSYTPRRRTADAMLRLLHAWRAGAPLVMFNAPWRSAESATPGPTPVFAPARQLARELAGRRFLGEFPVGTGMHGWLVQGAGSGDAAMIAWTDADPMLSGAASASSAPHMLRAQLADGPVRVIDAFGNEQVVEPRDGIHEIALSDLPIFIDVIDVELVQFRGSFAIEPAFVPAASKVHQHTIVLTNPWDEPIAGTLRLSSAADWRLVPAAQAFNIPAGGVARLPLEIIPDRSIIAGRREIDALVALSADQEYELRMQTAVEVGLRDIDLAASWSVAAARPVPSALQSAALAGEAQQSAARGDDLLVIAAVTNRGQTAANLDLDLLAPDVSQARRTIVGLEPGQTRTMTFRIARGAELLAGRAIRIGVVEREGVARLNRMLEIPARTATVSAEK